MSRKAPALIAVVSGLLLAGSVAVLTQRLAQFYRDHPTKHWVFQELDSRLFSYAGRNVSLEDEKDAAGTRYLNVAYGEQKLHLRVTIPHRQHDLLASHGLAAHRDWMRIMRFVEVSGMDPDRTVALMNEGKITDRLAMVCRIPRAGVDPQTWGEAWSKDWSFEFYEFLPDGSIANERLHYPTNKRGQPANPGELVEGSWQFDAALFTMPKAGIPNQQFINTGFKAMGWTFPVACLTTVAFVLSLVMAVYRPRPGVPVAPAAA